MKYVYLREIIKIISIIIIIVGSLLCIKVSNNLEINNYDLKAKYEIGLKTGSNSVKELEYLQKEMQEISNKANFLKYGGTTICLAVGIIIMISKDKLLNMIKKDDNL